MKSRLDLINENLMEAMPVQQTAASFKVGDKVFIADGMPRNWRFNGSVGKIVEVGYNGMETTYKVDITPEGKNPKLFAHATTIEVPARGLRYIQTIETSRRMTP